MLIDMTLPRPHLDDNLSTDQSKGHHDLCSSLDDIPSSLRRLAR